MVQSQGEGDPYELVGEGKSGDLSSVSLSAEQELETSFSTANPLQAIEAIDVSLLLDEEEKFLPASMVFCNELKARFRATQVSLGWLRGNHVIIRALSNTQKFDRRDVQLKHLAYAMEECADQDEEIIAPRLSEDTYISREHDKYLKLSKNDCILSLPVRDKNLTVGVVSLERHGHSFDLVEAQTLRLLVDLSSKRLQELEKRSQWFGKRLARGFHHALRWVFGLEHTWTKLGIVSGIAVLLLLFFYPWHYRVEAPFELKVEKMLHLPAPYDGFIHEVHFELGDTLKTDDILLSLDKRELLLEESASLAKLKRYESEALSYKSNGRFMESSLARISMQEERARLNLIHHRLALADIRVPFDGIVVEGDLKERAGSPVRRGEALFRIAKLDNVYVQIEIAEEDIHEVIAGATGEFAFTSRPEIKYHLVIEDIEPSAEAKSNGSVFYARCRIENLPEDWWRPGMNGVSKIDVGDRSIFWVLTHRLVDFIRMKLWI